MPGLAVDLDVPARLLDEAVDHAEAEAGALADLLGREERLEGAVDDLGRHAGRPIGDEQGNVVAGCYLDIVPCVLLVETDVGRLDQEAPASRHGIAGVDGKVEDCVLEARSVGQCRPQARGERGFHPDVLAERLPEHDRHARNDLVQVERCSLLSACLRANASMRCDEAAAAIGGIVDRFGDLGKLGVAGNSASQDLRSCR